LETRRSERSCVTMSLCPRDQGPRPVTVLTRGQGWTVIGPGHFLKALRSCRAHRDVTYGTHL
jgi:hypothetical protein